MCFIASVFGLNLTKMEEGAGVRAKVQSCRIPNIHSVSACNLTESSSYFFIALFLNEYSAACCGVLRLKISPHQPAGKLRYVLEGSQDQVDPAVFH
jgi:hypothetical protein